MNTQQVQDFCRRLPGVTEIEKCAPSNVLSFNVSDKAFLYFKTSEPEKWRMSIRVTPERFLELTDQPGIKPARYMHRFHWVTIVNVQSMDWDYLQILIHWSYDKALSKLSKKCRDSLLQNA